MKHIIQFDVLRVIAAFAVVLLHVSAQGFYNSFPSIEWEVRNFFDSHVRWGVPIFVMISGALFLDSQRNVNIKNLFSKNITRIIFIFFFWSIIYGFYDNRGGEFCFARKDDLGATTFLVLKDVDRTIYISTTIESYC